MYTFSSIRDHIIPKTLKCSNSAPKTKEDTKWFFKGFLRGDLSSIRVARREIRKRP